MSTKEDGGPAFPVVEDHPVHGSMASSYGMSLRDYFAGQALVGLMTRKVAGADGPGWHAGYAAVAYAVADAILAERAK